MSLQMTKRWNSGHLNKRQRSIYKRQHHQPCDILDQHKTVKFSPRTLYVGVNTATSTHPACPVNQVVQLSDNILPLAAGYRRWFGCCHCRALLSDWNHTATEGWRGSLPCADCLLCVCSSFQYLHQRIFRKVTLWWYSRFLHRYADSSVEQQRMKWACWMDSKSERETTVTTKKAEL